MGPRSNRSRAGTVITLGLILGLPTPLIGQQLLHEFQPEGAGYLAGGADLDGDGWPDVCLGLIRPSPFTPDEVAAFSGRDGALLWTVASTQGGDDLGKATAPVGDVDGDGVTDWLAGAALHDAAGADAGAAWLLSGRDGTVLRILLGQEPGEEFGHAVAGPGDLDGDGVPDLLVGAWKAGGEAGRVALFSGATGALLASLDGLTEEEWFGSSVAGLGDLDGDGVLEVAVGAPRADPPWSEPFLDLGRVSIHSGPALEVVAQLHGETGAHLLGRQVIGPGDVTGDDLPDLVTTAWVPGSDPDLVRIHHGPTLTRISQFSGPVSSSTIVVAAVGDVDFDGAVDLVTGSPSYGFKSIGRTDLRLSPHGHSVHSSLGQDLFQSYGSTVAGVGDFDRDGIPDYGVGSLAGYVRVYSGRVRTIQSLGGGLAGSAGTPALGMQGDVAPGGVVTAVLSAGVPRETAFLVLGLDLLDAPFAGGTLLPAPGWVVPLTLDASGRATWPAVVPPSAEPGTLLIMQGWIPDEGGPLGMAATNGLSIQVPWR